MTRHFLWVIILLVACFAMFNSTESGLIKVVPLSYRSTEVFLLIEGGQYTLNFTAARAACLSLNVTMATRVQMEEAVQRGLETCKYGWIAEKIGVIPRLRSDENCGKGKTGVVMWYAPEETKFGVFCFNTSAAADLDENQTTTRANLHSSTPPTSMTARTPTSTPTAPSVRPTIKSAAASTKKPTASERPDQISPTSTSAPLLGTTLSPRISTSGFPPYHTTVSPHQLITSKPSVVSLAFIASTQTFGSDLLQTSASSTKKTSLKDVSTTFIALGIVLLLLMAVGAAWRYQLNTSCWCQAKQDDLETEMWKKTHSETDLHSKDGSEENQDEVDVDTNSCHDIMFCVNPDSE